MTPQQILPFARRWLWLCMVGALIAATASYLVSSQLKRVYEARATLLLTPGQTASGSADYNLVLAAEQLATTYAQLLKTHPVLDAAILAGNLELSSDQVSSMVDATPIRNTQLIQITARAENPDLAAALPNLLAAAMTTQTQASQSGRFAVTMDALHRQTDQLTADMADRMSQLETLRAQAPTPDRDVRISGLQFELTRLQQSYDIVARSYEDTRLAAARTSDLLSVVDPARPPSTPTSPKVLLNVLAAGAVGLLAAAGVALMLEAIDDRLTSPERLARYTGLPILGLIPQRASEMPVTVDQLAASAGSPEYHGDLSRTTDAYRVLNTNLQFAAVGRPFRTLLITGSDPEAGKSTIAANLAIVVAQAGKKVVLVDADLRKPSLHEVFGVENRTGLTSLLVNAQLPTSGELVATNLPNLYLLPSGLVPPNPSELLASQSMRRRLNELSEMADLVILDSPPVLLASDPTVLGGLVDCALLVAHMRHTRGQHAAQATNILGNAGAHILGVVLNGVPQAGAGHYGYHAPRPGLARGAAPS
jgi:succinoglycan biosynthesis transport protein ExoP